MRKEDRPGFAHLRPHAVAVGDSLNVLGQVGLSIEGFALLGQLSQLDEVPFLLAVVLLPPPQAEGRVLVREEEPARKAEEGGHAEGGPQVEEPARRVRFHAARQGRVGHFEPVEDGGGGDGAGCPDAIVGGAEVADDAVEVGVGVDDGVRRVEVVDVVDRHRVAAGGVQR